MNISEFRAAVGRAGISHRDLAKELGMSAQTLYNKIDGISEFKNSEICKLAKILSLSMSDVNIIFFGGSVNFIHASSNTQADAS